MEQKRNRKLIENRRNRKNISFLFLLVFSAYFLLSYFLPFSYTYRKGKTVTISGFSMFSFKDASGYLLWSYKRRIVSYVAAGIRLLVSLLAVLSGEEIKKRATYLLSLLFLILLAGEIGLLVERNAYGDTNVYPHVNRIIQLILSVCFLIGYLVLAIILNRKKKAKKS